MKGVAGTEKEHVVPMSDAMIAVLKKLSPGLSRPAGNGVPEPGHRGKPLDATAALDAIQAVDANVTTRWRLALQLHGLGQRLLGYDRELLKLCLGAKGSKRRSTSRYARSSLLEHRRPIMQAWGDYCCGVAVLAPSVEQAA